MKYQVKVDGKVYEVEVEKVSGGHKSLSMSDFGKGSMSDFGAAPQNTQPAQTAPVNEPVKAPQQPKQEEVKSAPKTSTGGGEVLSPMPGTILKLNVSDGASVSAGDVILILEAMKMEIDIVAPVAGTISKIFTEPSKAVEEGQVLAVIS